MISSAKSEENIVTCLKEGCTNTDTIFQTDAQELHGVRKRDGMVQRDAGHHTGIWTARAVLPGCYQVAGDCVYCECDQGKKGLNEKEPQLEDVSLLSAPMTETSKLSAGPGHGEVESGQDLEDGAILGRKDHLLLVLERGLLSEGSGKNTSAQRMFNLG